jgi:hypothetical protein
MFLRLCTKLWRRRDDSAINYHCGAIMVPSETGYLFLLFIGFLSLTATVSVALSAYRHLRGRKSGQPVPDR